MKNKYVKSVMGLLLSVSLIAGGTFGVYAAQINVKTETATEAASEEESEVESETTSEEIAEQNAVYGEVKSVDGDTITFTVGTSNEIPSKGDPLDGAKESFLTLTSEEREITVSEETEIVKGMSPQGAKPKGNKPEGDTPMAEEENQKDTEAESEEDTEETTELTADKKSAESELKEEKLAVEDIKAGDVIKVSYDKDNNVTRIEVMSITETDEKPETAPEDMTKKTGASEKTTEVTSEVTTES